MFRINLKITRRSDDIMLLSPIPFFRIIFGIMACALMLGIYLNPGEKIPVLGIILILISIIAVFYEERWIFDRKGEYIEYRFGLIFFYKKTVIQFDMIDEFNYSDSTILRKEESTADETLSPRPGIMGGRPVKYSILSLITKDGKVRNIEVLKSRNSTELAAKGTEAAAFCGHELKTT